MRWVILSSAFHYSKKAFMACLITLFMELPFATVLSVKRDTIELNNAIDELTERNNPVIWRNFLIAYAASTAPGSYGISKRVNQVAQYYPNDLEIKNMQKTICYRTR